MNTKSPIKTELIAGLTTFLTMSYIIFVNPSILSTPGTGMSFSGVLTATVLLSALMTLFMGLYAKLPFAVAPGMGLNAFFTFTLVLSEGIPWPTALGLVFWAGAFFLLISLTPLREKLAESLPDNLKIASAVGIGLFLSFIGFKNAGWVVSDQATFVKMGPLNPSMLLSFVGLMIILVMMRKKSVWAFLVSILTVTLLAIPFGLITKPESLTAMPDFSSVFFKLDIWGALKFSFIPAILSIVFTDMFDSISTFVGVSRAANLVDAKGNPLRMKQALIVDSFATMLAGVFGTSAGTAYIESAAGIEAGGRTGLTSVFTALFFLPCLFLSPLIGVVPAFATAPVLISVGLLMFKNIFDLKRDHFEEWVPAALTIILIPLTFSITKGLMAGLFIQWLLYLLCGRIKDISVALWILGIVSGAYLAH
ncbi:MAG: NCS2 family permease [Bacteriovoracaceae bacterium]|nr:NCS2 family permease [Bacteriovoracaceae bacterium]